MTKADADKLKGKINSIKGLGMVQYIEIDSIIDTMTTDTDPRIIRITAKDLQGEDVVMLDTAEGIAYVKALMHLGRYRNITIDTAKKID